MARAGVDKESGDDGRLLVNVHLSLYLCWNGEGWSQRGKVMIVELLCLCVYIILPWQGEDWSKLERTLCQRLCLHQLGGKLRRAITITGDDADQGKEVMKVDSYG